MTGVLKKLGFTLRNQEGSHEQWVREGNPFRKVTVDKPKSPFHGDLIMYMALQAGVTKKEFYSLVD
ncbi:TPA: type II toxin-antitoxin system HicA family toxin [Pseudomonas aeruginosa]|nr:type II toxin-antitoxin system HicA family toxin [Pseudomonas aeruginosa]HBN8446496.1 type II toxin-antitoxin system HicA family toxin [Pseudomonas aeruginosa]HCL3327563.1 type II toxin-antitoxin system HicA family toxin [Pseudomonas aeruginosa]